MKRLFLALLSLVFVVPVAVFVQSAAPSLSVQINGIDLSRYPTVQVNVNVVDMVGQSVLGLGVDNFAVLGDLAPNARVVDVQNVTDDALDISVVLAIDTSTSMEGEPLERAKAAAISFINLIGEKDSVALVAFDSRERLVQDFTSDKQALTDAVNGLFASGRTALYDGSVLAIETAVNAPSPRHTVIILSDGAEYGNLSSSEREAASATALEVGVPSNTIGLGFGTDRTFLKDLSSATLARFYESPTPDELQNIYAELANALRTQYIVTLELDSANVEVGKDFQLVLQVTSDNSVATALGSVRVPVPVPVVALPAMPSAPISEPTTITVDVQADDPITSAEFQLNGVGQGALSAAPFVVTIDPVTLPPGTNTLGFSVTDSTGDTTNASTSFEVAVLSPVVNVIGVPEGELSAAQDIILDVTGQTPAASAVYSVDGVEQATVNQVPFTFTLDPFSYAPGEHTLNLVVTNEGGGVTPVEIPFSVVALPPSFAINGLDTAQAISEPTTIVVNVEQSQGAVSSMSASVDGTEIASSSGQNQLEVTIDPSVLPPGSATLSIVVNGENGQQTTQDVPFEVAALPAEVTINGLTAGETLDADREISLDVTSQTAVSSVQYLLDGVEIAAPTAAPYSAQIDALAAGEGGHILTVIVTNEGGQTSSVDTAFAVSAAPALTATASVPTSTPVPTNTPEPTSTPAPTNTPVEPTAVPTDVSASGQNTNGETTPEATAVEPTIAPPEATAADATETTPEATAAVSSDQVATQTAVAQTDAVLTQQAASAADAQATKDAQQAVDVKATAQAADAQATAQAADAQATAQAADAQATAQAADAKATSDAQVAAQTTAEQATADVKATEAGAQVVDATAEVTAEATVEATQEVTTVDATAEVTVESTSDVAPVTPTGEATTTAGRTPEPTFTPIPLSAETQTAATSTSQIPIALIAGIGLLILIVLYFVFGRRGKK